MFQIKLSDIKAFSKSHIRRPMQHPVEIVNFLNIALEKLQSQTEIIFIEIGVCNGANFVFMGDMFQRFFHKVYGIGIDLPGITKYAGVDLNLPVEIKKLFPTFKYDLIIGDSTHKETINTTLKFLAGRPVDVLFIDGDHSYKGCMDDFNNYSPFVKPGGIIGFHDLGENRFDVKTKIWPEIKTKYPEYWEFVEKPGHFGIGAIIK